MTMDRMQWFKWWDGTAADPKLRMIAEACKMPVASVLGIWGYLLEKASRSSDRGVIPADLDMELMAYTLQLSEADIETVRNGMKRSGLVTETGSISKWEDRQAKREKYEPVGSSTHRVKAFRDRQKSAGNNDLGGGSGGNCDVTVETDETAGNGRKRHKKKNKSREDIKPKPSSSSSDDGATPKPFDRFWLDYPRKVGKQAAQKAWSKLKPNAALLDAILEAIAAQKDGADWKRDAGEYIPHPSTWLNGGRWLDEVRTYVPPAIRRSNDAWWESKEAMEAKGRSINPPVLPLPGDTMGSYKRRIQEAIERGDAPPLQAMPTPYVPPAPAGGESVLTPEQHAARRAEVLALVGSRRPAPTGVA